MSSLFGSLNNPAKSDNGGLFGPPKPPASAAGGGMFGGGTSTVSGGLFGGMGASTATTQPGTTGATGGGLFGGSLAVGSSTQPLPANNSGGLFGGLGAGGATTQQPPGGSVFGGLGTSTQQNNANNMFGTVGQPVSSAGLAASTTASLTSQQNSQNAYFDAILERSRKRAHAEAVSEDIPQLQLGLGDIRQRIKRLGAEKADLADGRAHYLLAASGVDPGAAARDLDLLTAAATRAERTYAPDYEDDGDVETYLEKLQTQSTLNMISDGISRSIQDFEAFLDENVAIEWGSQQKKIYQHFGIKPKETAGPGGRGSFRTSPAAPGTPPGKFGASRRSKAAGLAASRAGGESTFARSNLHRSVIGSAGPIGTGHQPLFADVEKEMEANGVSTSGLHDRFQRDKQNKYAEKVQLLNHARLAKYPFPLAKEFADVVDMAGDQHGPDLVKAYKSLVEIVGEDPEAKSFSENRTAKERQFASAYLSDIPNAATLDVRRRILRGGARCLEKLAFEKMEDLVTKNPRDANLGGIPNTINKIKAYVRLQGIKKNLAGNNDDLQILGEDYVWALIYYLLRSGHVAEADEYVRTKAIAFRAIDRSFGAYMHAYATDEDRRLGDDLQVRINAEYHQRLRIAPENSIDPYRMACYKIIGRCDLRSRTLEGIKQDIEDFAWIQVVLAREITRSDSMSTEVYDLTAAQDTIREIGNRFFSKAGGAEIGSSFGAFVFLQVSLGMFEEAVHYLYTHSYVDGIHLAIALDFYGLLRVSDPTAAGEDLMSRTTRNQPQISFGRSLGFYTRDFRAANVSAAVDYLVLICLNQDLPGQAGANQVMLCHEGLRELALESREFALLLGDMRSDGQRINGLIEDRVALIGLQEADDFMRTITMQAASVADDSGRTTDAVLLYHLAAEYDNVIVTINRALSEAIAVPLGQESLKLHPLKTRSTTNAQNMQGTESNLTSVDDPFVLAEKMSDIYAHQMYRSKIKLVNQQACATLQRMYQAKNMVENAMWPEALDLMRSLSILPLEARGDATTIRSSATKFTSLPQTVAQNVPNLLMWSIICCNNQRSLLINSQFGGNEGTRQAMIDELKQMNMDLTTYTSQLRYRFPANIHEALARAQSE
ncbi:hypothetical protein QTJ16_006273 [Diplocarpon rosae]|uniref:Nucleoporin-interacting protein NIC96 n=1 Tax=Diplocarpon rosae TaxID=946125 RepID=A0AAD9STF9_9HELO|nr:hypothetical protein QTJ16_006273 [Diplocarpon rosae]